MENPTHVYRPVRPTIFFPPPDAMFPFFLGLLLHQAVIPKAAGCELKLSHPAVTIFSSGNFTIMKPYLSQMGVPHVSIFQAPFIDNEYLKLYNQCSPNPKDCWFTHRQSFSLV